MISSTRLVIPHFCFAGASYCCDSGIGISVSTGSINRFELFVCSRDVGILIHGSTTSSPGNCLFPCSPFLVIVYL